MSNESRIREMKRKLLHEKNPVIRNIWKEHIEFLENNK